MNKLKDLEFIRNYCKKSELTAYKIAKDTGLSSVGIQRILNGYILNPRKSTLDTIKKYIDNLDISNNETQNLAEEPDIKYSISLGYEEKILKVEDEINLRESIIKSSTDPETIDHHHHMITLLKLQIIEIQKAKNNHLLEK